MIILIYSARGFPEHIHQLSFKDYSKLKRLNIPLELLVNRAEPRIVSMREDELYIKCQDCLPPSIEYLDLSLERGPERHLRPVKQFVKIKQGTLPNLKRVRFE